MDGGIRKEPKGCRRARTLLIIRQCPRFTHQAPCSRKCSRPSVRKELNPFRTLVSSPKTEGWTMKYSVLEAVFSFFFLFSFSLSLILAINGFSLQAVELRAEFR